MISRFSNDNDPFTKAELTLLFFDMISCPFISLDTKKKIIKESKYEKEANVEIEINKINKHKTWFMDWDIEIDLERVLKKKEWGASY